MSNYFHPGQSSSGWLRIGRIEVTSTVAVVLVGVVGILASVIVSQLPYLLAYDPAKLLAGELWRIFTWPLADTLNLFSVINLFVLWYFGQHLEATLGRKRMAVLYLGAWAALTLSATAVALFGPTALFGLQLVELAILLLWTAQHPTLRFLFNIPAWAFGTFLLAFNVLQMISTRRFTQALVMLLAFAMFAIISRSLGLLTAYPWLPGGTRQPTSPAKRTVSKPQRSSSVSERIDELLDKINAEGLNSLTKRERAELQRLRKLRHR